MKPIMLMLIWLLTSFPVNAVPEETYKIDPLVAIVEACQDALALGDKGTAYTIARKVRWEALSRFKDDPRQLAPLLLLYADAAASYNDRGALVAYREALTAYEKAFGLNSAQLIEPVMRAAREALARRFRVEAYALFQRILELSALHKRDASAFAAIAKTGIASLHVRVGENMAARRYLDEALQVDTRTLSVLDLGWIYHVSADAHMALENWQQANDDYTQAYGLYQADNTNSEDLLTILKRLIKANHMMGYTGRAASFCQRYAERKDWGNRMLFDPSAKMTNHIDWNIVSVGVEYTINSKCKAVDVKVTHAEGMDVEAVKNIVENAYWLPRFTDGELVSTAIQRVPTLYIVN